MSLKIELIGIEGIPLIKPNDNIAKLILQALTENKIELVAGDILLIAQTIISKSQGLIRDIKSYTPSQKALSLYNHIAPKAKQYNLPIKSPEHIQAILDESKEIVKADHVLIVETKQGYVCANAGIDKSNVEGKNMVALLPKNPDADADQIRKFIKEKTQIDVAIIITDSFGRPFRVGAVGVGIGIAGINAIVDKRGEKDLFGYELESTIIGQIDNLASAAQLIMGEGNEGLPVVLLRGYKYQFSDSSRIQPILRSKNTDIFRRRNIEQILMDRRSYKLEFNQNPPDRDLIEECINLARWAPSAHNYQFWRYLIFQKDQEERVQLIHKMNEKLRMDLTKDGKSEDFIEHKINRTRTNFLEAPFLILLCLDTTDLDSYPDTEREQNEFILGVQSISASATYFLLSLEAKGIAACWYCAPLFAKEIIKELLKLPESFIPMAFITAGYALKEMKPPKRKHLSEVIYNYQQKE